MSSLYFPDTAIVGVAPPEGPMSTSSNSIRRNSDGLPPNLSAVQLPSTELSKQRSFHELVVVSSDLQQERLDQGQCASCGQQLFEIKQNKRSRSFGFRSKPKTDDLKIKRKPLTVPGLVERGQCLKCGDDHTPVTACTGSEASSTDLQQHLQQTLSTALCTTTKTKLVAGTATYEGAVNAYGERHGQGTMTWSNGDVYRGEFYQGQRQGQGTLHFSDGSEYVGEWKDNAMHGSGTRRFPNGDIYTGTYRQGQRSGQGRFYFGNGDLYCGAWRQDSIGGFGRYYYSSGQRFEGTFVQGQRHGLGKTQRVDGSLDIYRYTKDVRQPRGVRWSPDRARAWLLDNGRIKKKISIAEAVSITYELENLVQPSSVMNGATES